MTEKKPQPNDSCETCRFWKRNNDTTQWGRCRFQPPNVLANDETWTGGKCKIMVWPDTMDSDWCGKFEKQLSASSRQLTDSSFQRPVGETEDSEVQFAEILSDMLELVDVLVPVQAILTWTSLQKSAAEEWAAAVYLDASDNDVTVPPKPDFLP